MKTSEKVDQIFPAFISAWGELKGAKLNKVNPYFNSRFADLESVYDAVKETLIKHGLGVIQLCDNSTNEVVIETVLMHFSGQFISSRLTMPLPKNDPQAVGAVISYARRYALSAICSISSQEDTDAEEAMDRKKHEPEIKPERKAIHLPTNGDKEHKTLDDVKRVGKLAIEKIGHEAVNEVLGNYGYKTSKDIPQDKYDEMYEVLVNL